MNISTSEENYLKAIYHLSADSDSVSTNALAQKLKSKPASITEMTKRLNTKGLLHYKPYYGFSLSMEGKKLAIEIIRRHRLWEYFLAEKLGFGWDQVHDLADELEHVGNKKLISKLDAYLGFPSVDPHGDPIPDSKGRIKTVKHIPLHKATLHQQAQISRVRNQSSEMLDLLAHRKISIGAGIEVKKHFLFDGSLQIKIDGRTEIISDQLAQNIFVTYEEHKH